MAIDKISLGASQIKPIQSPIEEPFKPKEVEKSSKSEDFGDLFVNALQQVDQLQKDADTKITQMVTGEGGITPHQAMITLEKADIAFQLMNQIRGKIVRAYEEILRTQV